MSIWEGRNEVLQAIYTSGVDYQHFPDLRRTLPHWSPDELQTVLHWLMRHGLIVGPMFIDGGVSTFRISPLGENFTETTTSLEALSRQSVQGAIMHYQHNVNNGPAVNSMGDNNIISQSNQSQLVDEIIATLRTHKEEERAQELEQEKTLKGPGAAIAKGAGWVANKVLAPPVLVAVAPLVAQAMGLG